MQPPHQDIAPFQTEQINLPLIARAFYFEPLALDISTALSVHAWLWPRITGKDPMPTHTAAGPNTNSIQRGGGMAHTRQQMAAPAMQSNGPFAPATMLDPNYFWTLDDKPNVAVIPINGMICKGASGMQEMCMGAVNTDRVAFALKQAIAAKAIDTIVLDVNSPGGKVTGMQELAGLVKQATDTRGKTVYAWVEQQCASAAECIVCQADEIALTPSASIGSIGTYLAFLDPSMAMQLQGYALQFFGSGKHKGLGLPGKPLTQDDRAYLQSSVDKINAQFVATVQAGPRKVASEALTDAKMYNGTDAVTVGLADGIMDDWDEFCSLL